ncbi:hypothetical protein Tco_0093318, partial [Tanacetum coccineum]
MPFGVIHAGSSLLARQHRAQRYIMPFGAMHYGSPLLIGGQQRGTTSSFSAMHIGSSLLARQHR